MERLDPAIRERDRATSRRWKRQNRERNRARDQAYGRHPCDGCDALVTRQATLCQDCEIERKQARRREIQRRWLAGGSLKQIAAALESTPNAIGVTISYMREDGWEMPHRRAKRKAVAA